MKILALLAVSAILGLAASPLLPSEPPDPDTNLPAQQVGPGDLLAIAVADCPELSRSFRVAADGTLALPLLNEPMKVADKYPSDIGKEIAKALVDQGILVSPVVTVSVAQYRSVPVTVFGAVHHPITFQAVGPVTLIDAITRAEGLSDDAGPEILVSQPAADGKAGLVQRVPVKGLIDEADPQFNIRLHGGEEIRVPPAGKFYVVGNVKKSGAFPISQGNDSTVLKAIALSEGLLPYTNKQAYIYRREAGKSSRDEIPVQLSRILDHKAADVALRANDILYIPDSKGRRMTAQTLERIAGFGTATASGLLIWK
ncbi:MAG TPA: polysaccharide biosynthesis/export family protein [Bryobacteraceae bacterium]|nr:polysaccharide biosynthesis/export family protein [Bryobacteraceae bacterium]